MQLAGAEIDIVPAQGYKLAGAQPVAVGEQDRGCVPMTPTVAAGGVHQLLDLPPGQNAVGAASAACRLPMKMPLSAIRLLQTIVLSQLVERGKLLHFRCVLPNCHNDRRRSVRVELAVRSLPMARTYPTQPAADAAHLGSAAVDHLRPKLSARLTPVMINRIWFPASSPAASISFSRFRPSAWSPPTMVISPRSGVSRSVRSSMRDVMRLIVFRGAIADAFSSRVLQLI